MLHNTSSTQLTSYSLVKYQNYVGLRVSLNANANVTAVDGDRGKTHPSTFKNKPTGPVGTSITTQSETSILSTFLKNS